MVAISGDVRAMLAVIVVFAGAVVVLPQLIT